jgi:hypothetical protein
MPDTVPEVSMPETVPEVNAGSHDLTSIDVRSATC